MVVFTKDAIRTVWSDTLLDAFKNMDTMVRGIISEEAKADPVRLGKCQGEVKMLGTMLVPLFMDLLPSNTEYYGLHDVLLLSATWAMSSVISDSALMAEYLEGKNSELIKCLELICDRVPSTLVVFWLSRFEERLQAKAEEIEEMHNE